MVEPVKTARKTHKEEPVSQGTGSSDGQVTHALDVSWDDLIQWAEWIIATYRLGRYIPPCWPEHPGVVQELRSLYFFRQMAERQLNDWGNGLELWHASLKQMVERVGPLISPCTQTHHEPEPTSNRDISAYARTGILDVKPPENLPLQSP